jgi:protein SCO1/2
VTSSEFGFWRGALALALAFLGGALACGERRGEAEGIAGRSGSFEAAESSDARDPAPSFELVDQDAKPFSSASLLGRAVLVDFIFTSCSGPCPIQTGLHAALQRRLAPELRERVALVSISVDPERDTPERLRDYARTRGADLSNWSFLTGSGPELAELLRGFGIGVDGSRGPELLHTTASFVIDPEGCIARRLTGVEHSPQELEAALRDVL